MQSEWVQPRVLVALAETQAHLSRFPELELQRLGEDYETMRSYEETKCMPAQAN
jgi:hypothetical protein